MKTFIKKYIFMKEKLEATRLKEYTHMNIHVTKGVT